MTQPLKPRLESVIYCEETGLNTTIVKRQRIMEMRHRESRLVQCHDKKKEGDH